MDFLGDLKSINMFLYSKLHNLRCVGHFVRIDCMLAFPAALQRLFDSVY